MARLLGEDLFIAFQDIQSNLIHVFCSFQPAAPANDHLCIPTNGSLFVRRTNLSEHQANHSYALVPLI